MKKSIALFFALSLSVNLAFADSIADTSNYLPGGPYRLFGSGRGSIDNINNYIRVGGGLSQKVGNLSIETTTYKGGVSYTQEFHNHGWQVHSPFANTAKQEFHSKNGKIVNGGGATLTDLSVTGYEIHPADGYDGEQGGGYPTPTGARDEYAYLVNGKEVSVRIVDLDKLPPKANDDKVLRNVGIDPTPYNQT
ncbi:MAG: MafB family polymorphic toxin, partial [Neisseriaceae bacterium]|nr:MafB family polymorphic toxin [Neisseriaceae bacterium]